MTIGSDNPMATAAARPQPVEIPNKLYFRIGDVSRLTGIKTYVLRYWETEFSQLSPKKSGTNQRLYRRKDVEMVLEIKHLLYEKRYTIEGARTYFQERKSLGKAVAAAAAGATSSQSSLFGPSPVRLDAVCAELKAIADLLQS